MKPSIRVRNGLETDCSIRQRRLTVLRGTRRSTREKPVTFCRRNSFATKAVTCERSLSTTYVNVRFTRAAEKNIASRKFVSIFVFDINPGASARNFRPLRAQGWDGVSLSTERRPAGNTVVSARVVDTHTHIRRLGRAEWACTVDD